jgi:hypothetical protein
MTSKIVRLFMLAVLVVGMSFTASAATVGFDYTSAVATGGAIGTGNGSIDFAGDGTFSFSEVYNFTISFAHPDLAGLVGRIGGLEAPVGGFAIGPIFDAGGGLLIAGVTGGGKLYIDDNDPGSTAEDLTADLDFVSIFTFGTTGGLNAGGSANLSNFSYGGTDADLIKIVNDLYNKNIVASFTFTPAKSLDVLATSANSTTFSGTFSGETIPEPGTYALMGAGLAALALLRRKKA